MSYEEDPLDTNEFRLSLVHLKEGSDIPVELHFQFYDTSREAVLATLSRALPNGFNTDLEELV